jgi:hypothetical protein
LATGLREKRVRTDLADVCYCQLLEREREERVGTDNVDHVTVCACSLEVKYIVESDN